MNLKELADGAASIQSNHSILAYGPPKAGKTELIGTAARIEEIERIFWFDIENGVETLLGMGLSDDELRKITIIKIADTRDDPIAIETMLKALTSKTPIQICETHGRVDCAACKRLGKASITFLLSSLTHSDLIVIDSGSQLGDSALAAACIGQPNLYKPKLDEYGQVNKWLGDVMSVIQQCVNTNFIVATHEMCMEDDEGKEKFVPLMGSRAFSIKCAKYFGTVIYVHKKLNKHVAGSSSVYLGNRLTGSRVRAVIENDAKPDMRTILIGGGIIKEGGGLVSKVDRMVNNLVKEIETATNNIVPIKLTLAERIAAQKKSQFPLN